MVNIGIILLLIYFIVFRETVFIDWITFFLITNYIPNLKFKKLKFLKWIILSGNSKKSKILAPLLICIFLKALMH